MRKVKITVIRKEFYPDFADKFLSDGKDAGGLLPMGVDCYLPYRSDYSSMISFTDIFLIFSE